MSENESLALLNAVLVGTSVACMLIGRRAARRRQVRRHCGWMCAALALQAVFLVAFVTRFVRWGPTEPSGDGVYRVVCTVILLAHEPIAVVSIPLVLCTAALGLARRVETHREVARLTYPLWLFVSLTGVVVYLLLYA